MFDMKRFVDAYATIGEIHEWAVGVMDSRGPDFVIGGDYMYRWFIIPRNAVQNLYLHATMRSDDDVMHDHPWDNTSLLIAGRYVEHTPEGSFLREPGAVVKRNAWSAHRLQLLDGPTVSLFFTGPKVRDWGFHCPKGWVPWQEFTGGYHDGRSDKGAGCGEYA